MFCILAVVILGSAVMCVFTKSIMRSVVWLLFVLFGISGIYFLLDYTFLGATQLSIYAGGVTILFVFAIQLVSKFSLQNLVGRFKGSRAAGIIIVSLIGFLAVAMVVANAGLDTVAISAQNPDVEVPMSKIGSAMVGSGKNEYVLPFEFISVFLLACIVGGIMIARKEDDK